MDHQCRRLPFWLLLLSRLSAYCVFLARFLLLSFVASFSRPQLGTFISSFAHSPLGHTHSLHSEILFTKSHLPSALFFSEFSIYLSSFFSSWNLSFLTVIVIIIIPKYWAYLRFCSLLFVSRSPSVARYPCPLILKFASHIEAPLSTWAQ